MLANFQIIVAGWIEGGNLQQIYCGFNQLITSCIDRLEQGLHPVFISLHVCRHYITQP